MLYAQQSLNSTQVQVRMFRHALVVTLGLVVVLLACRDPDPKCTSVTGAIPSKMTLASCSDGRTREVSCSSTNPREDWLCACTVNGSLGRTFNWTSNHAAVDGTDRRDLEELLSRQCHWSLRLH